MNKYEHFIAIGLCAFSAVIGLLIGYLFFEPSSFAEAANTQDGYLQQDVSIEDVGIELFSSSEEMLLVPELPPQPAHLYVLTSQDGYIIVRYAEGNGEGIRTITSTPVTSLAWEEQERLADGIRIYTEEALIRILEDYGS